MDSRLIIPDFRWYCTPRHFMKFFEWQHPHVRGPHTDFQGLGTVIWCFGLSRLSEMCFNYKDQSHPGWITCYEFNLSFGILVKKDKAVTYMGFPMQAKHVVGLHAIWNKPSRYNKKFVRRENYDRRFWWIFPMHNKHKLHLIWD